MLRELVRIPFTYNDVPIFGPGVLLVLWLLVAAVSMAVIVRRHGWNSQTRSYLPFFLVVAAVLYILPFVFDKGLPIRGYGVMMLLAVVSGVALAMYLARRVGLDPEIILSLAFWMFVAGIVGARIFYVIEYWEQSFKKPTLGETVITVLKFSEGGLVVYGALIAVLVAVVFFVRKHRLPGLALADLIAPSMALGQGIGRIGCLLNGCCFGGYCDLPWGVQFPPESPPYARIERGMEHGLRFDGKAPQAIVSDVKKDSPAGRAGIKPGTLIVEINGTAARTPAEAQRLLDVGTANEVPFSAMSADGESYRWVLPPGPAQTRPLHPTQIYAAIDAILLAAFLLAYYPFRRRDGEVIALALTIHPITRFLLEEIRIDEAGMWGTPFSISQIVGGLILIGAAALWVYVLRQPRGTAWPVIGAGDPSTGVRGKPAEGRS
jgi:phosphatidylglycerol:prolipoprotein diacylglycerol transferase